MQPRSQGMLSYLQSEIGTRLIQNFILFILLYHYFHKVTKKKNHKHQFHLFLPGECLMKIKVLLDNKTLLEIDGNVPAMYLKVHNKTTQNNIQ